MNGIDAPHHEITSRRLTLRQLTIADAPVIAELRSDPVVNRYINRPPAVSTADALDWIIKRKRDFDENRSFVWGICEKGSPRIAGTICLFNFSADRLRCEVGYELFPPFHGKGIMSEALTTVLQCAETRLNVKSVEAFTYPENQYSIALLEKHGFVLDDSRHDPDNQRNIIFVKVF